MAAAGGGGGAAAGCLVPSANVSGNEPGCMGLDKGSGAVCLGTIPFTAQQPRLPCHATAAQEAHSTQRRHGALTHSMQCPAASQRPPTQTHASGILKKLWVRHVVRDGEHIQTTEQEL